MEAHDNILAIVQARVGSTRLPGKVLADIAGEPMLTRVVSRVAAAQKIDAIVVATSNTVADDRIVELCCANCVAVYRGSESDVLDRYYQAAKEHRAAIVVRVTADCPLIDPQVIDRVIAAYLTDIAIMPPTRSFAPIRTDSMLKCFPLRRRERLARCAPLHRSRTCHPAFCARRDAFVCATSNVNWADRYMIIAGASMRRGSGVCPGDLCTVAVQDRIRLARCPEPARWRAGAGENQWRANSQ